MMLRSPVCTLQSLLRGTVAFNNTFITMKSAIKQTESNIMLCEYPYLFPCFKEPYFSLRHWTYSENCSFLVRLHVNVKIWIQEIYFTSDYPPTGCNRWVSSQVAKRYFNILLHHIHRDVKTLFMCRVQVGHTLWPLIIWSGTFKEATPSY